MRKWKIEMGKYTRTVVTERERALAADPDTR